MQATDKEGNTYRAGGLSQTISNGASFASASLLERLRQLKASEDGDSIDIFISKNEEPIGWLSMQDELRAESKMVVDYLHSKNIKTILLSGDRLSKCRQIADQLGIQTVIAEQSPEQKLSKIAELSAKDPTIMVGDGINDAPALAKALSVYPMNDASQIALQSSHVVLMNQGLKKLPMALGLGRHTFLTIKQNLFWAFAYNIVAIPVAAFGLLTPTFGALVMGMSDVVLAINSVRLFVKKVV
jgi:Cu+-exporting ATPase